MRSSINISKKIKSFNKTILVTGDKSISIRWVLLSSLSNGKSRAKNLLLSEDVYAAIEAIKKLGAKAKVKKDSCEIQGVGINGYRYKKNIVINARNSGTLGRLILGLLINSTFPIKIIGDQSLSRRDFTRVTSPLSKFGAKFKLNKNKTLPLKIFGTQKSSPISYFEKKGSAQCKSSVMFAAMKTEGKTFIKAKKSRNHTELLLKYLKLPIKVRSKKNFDFIELNKVEKISPINYKIPSDISSGSFFIVLATLVKNSELLIKNVNINPSRIGIITILRKMGAKIKFEKQKIYKGEKIANIRVKSPKKLKSINCSTKLNSGAIDEFLVIFLVAAKAKGVSFFKNLSELNQKESPRLEWGSRVLNLMGVKTKTTKDSLKIYGNPNLKVDKKIIIKNYLKDHRVFMTSVIAALAFGGKWTIHDKDSIKTSFPSFLKIINDIKK